MSNRERVSNNRSNRHRFVVHGEETNNRKIPFHKSELVKHPTFHYLLFDQSQSKNVVSTLWLNTIVIIMIPK